MLLRRLRRRLTDERGFTLLELVTASALLMITVASMLSVFETLQRAAVREQSRAETTDQVRISMDRMTKEIRQAETIRAGSTASFLDMDTYIDGQPKHIIYDATEPNVLKRTVDGNTVTLLERLTISALFTYEPDATDPAVITVELVAKPEKFQRDPTEIALQSQVKLRNR